MATQGAQECRERTRDTTADNYDGAFSHGPPPGMIPGQPSNRAMGVRPDTCEAAFCLTGLPDGVRGIASAW